jgi:hypothetical protein
VGQERREREDVAGPRGGSAGAAAVSMPIVTDAVLAATGR